MKSLVIVLSLLVTTYHLFAADPWPNVPYTEVRAYYYNEAGKNFLPIIKDGHLDASVVNKEGTLVPPATVKAFLAIVNTKRYESLRPGCYFPRNAMIFYDKAHKVVAVYEVCFACLLQSSEPEGIAPLTDMAAVAKIFEHLKLPLGPQAKSAKDVAEKWANLSQWGALKPTP